MKMIRHPRRKSWKPLHALPICHADFGLYELREYLLFPLQQNTHEDFLPKKRKEKNTDEDRVKPLNFSTNKCLT